MIKEQADKLENVTALVFSNDSKFLASSVLDKIIIIWNLKTLTKTQNLNGYSALHFKFSPNNKFLVFSADIYDLKVWNL